MMFRNHYKTRYAVFCVVMVLTSANSYAESNFIPDKILDKHLLFESWDKDSLTLTALFHNGEQLTLKYLSSHTSGFRAKIYFPIDLWKYDQQLVKHSENVNTRVMWLIKYLLPGSQKQREALKSAFEKLGEIVDRKNVAFLKESRVDLEPDYSFVLIRVIDVGKTNDIIVEITAEM